MKLDEVKNSELLKGLDGSELDAVAALFEERRIEEGKTVFVENMPGESLYLIEQGTVQVTRMLAEGDEKTLVILGPEDVFGEMALLEAAPRAATARVAEDARLMSLSRRAFEDLCDRNPGLGLKLMRNISRTLCRRMRENAEEYREMLIWALNRPNA